jgi:hypothetical protein
MKLPRPDGFSGEFYRTLKINEYQSFKNVQKKFKERRTLPKSPYEVNIFLIPNPDKDVAINKSYRLRF